MTDHDTENSRGGDGVALADEEATATPTVESVLDPDDDTDIQQILADESVAPLTNGDGFETAFDGDHDTHTRERPETAFETYHRLTRESRRVQSKLPFDFVRDDGIIVADGDYIGLIDVTPRTWHVLSTHEREQVFEAYASFILAIKYPAQELMVPHEFDVSQHAENVHTADQNAPADESRVLHHGRRQYIQFTNDAIDAKNVKDPKFYLVVRVDSDHLAPDTDESGHFGFVKQAVESVGETFGLTTDTTAVSPGEAVEEVGERIAEIDSTITQVGVQSEPIRSREAVMDILYYQYNHAPAPFDQFDHQTYSEHLPTTASQLEGDA